MTAEPTTGIELRRVRLLERLSEVQVGICGNRALRVTMWGDEPLCDGSFNDRGLLAHSRWLADSTPAALGCVSPWAKAEDQPTTQNVAERLKRSFDRGVRQVRVSQFGHYVLSIFAAAGILAGCGGHAATGVFPSADSADTIFTHHHTFKSAILMPASNAKLYLYAGDCCGVLNGGGVKVYDPGQQRALRHLVRWAKIPQRLRIDRTGTLYVLNGSNVGPEDIAVSEFDGGHEKMSRRVGYFYWATTFALDGTNKLYVANCNTCVDSGVRPAHRKKDSMTVYGAHSTMLLRTITDGVHSPSSLAFDSRGNLYVSNSGIKGKHASITVYAPGSTTPLHTITRGIDHPGSLAIDRSDDLFVTNCTSTISGTPQIIEYAARSDKILRTLTDEIKGPDVLAVDNSGTLYVSNWPLSPSEPGWISIYALKSTKPEKVITTKIDQPVDIALGGDGNLYVANLGGWISVYAPNARKPLRLIESSGLGDARSLTFGSH